MRSVQVQAKSPSPPSSSSLTTSQAFHLPDETVKFLAQLPPVHALTTATGNASASSSSGSDAPTDPLLFQGRENEQNQSNAMGYDFSFINTPLDEDLICVICSLVCRDAVETSCSHIFCSSCLQRWLKQKNECVTCRSALSRSDVHASGFIRRKILGLKVKCVNSAACDWTGELRYMSTHLRKECQMQKLIQATNIFVETSPHQNNATSASPTPYATSSSSSSSSSTTTIGGRIPSEVLVSLREQLPASILRSLPAAALHRLLSLHSFHSLARDESHPLFNLSNSCVMSPYYRSSTSNTFTSPDQTWFSQTHLQCSSNCLLPPPMPSPSPDGSDLQSSSEHNDSSQRREVLAKQLHDILAARRAQYEDLFRRMTSFFQGAPVKVLQNFLASKGVNLDKGALEKSELVAECMSVRNQPDQEEYRKKVGASPLKGFGDASSLDSDRDYFGSTGYRAAAPNNRGGGGGAFAAALDEAGLDLMTQLHLAALQAHSHAHQNQNSGSAAVNSAIMNAHFQAHALHAAQHMLGFNAGGGAGGGGVSMHAHGLANGVVISMRMGSNGSMHVSSFDRNSDVIEAERRAREEQQQARIRRAEDEARRQIERREREREMALRDRGSALAGSSSSLDGSGLNRNDSYVSSNVLFQRANSNSGIAPDNSNNLPAGATSQSSNRNARRYSREDKNSNRQQPPKPPTSCCTIM